MFYTDDPVADFQRHDAEQAERLKRYPKCAHCGEAITEERLLNIHGELFHVDCAIAEFEGWTEDCMV